MTKPPDYLRRINRRREHLANLLDVTPLSDAEEAELAMLDRWAGEFDEFANDNGRSSND